MERPDLQSIEHGQHIRRHARDGVGPGRDTGQPMAAQIQPHHAQPAGKGGRLRVPDVQAGAQRVQQDQHRRTRRAALLHMHRQAGNIYEHGTLARAFTETVSRRKAR